jgi:hypothetical protein
MKRQDTGSILSQFIILRLRLLYLDFEYSRSIAKPHYSHLI